MSPAAARDAVAPRRDPRTLLSALRRGAAHVPRAAWICALVAVLNALAWSLIAPAFAIPDEQWHYAYTEYLVHRGHPPRGQPEDVLSSSEATATRDLQLDTTRLQSANPTIWHDAEQRTLDRDLAHEGPRGNGNGAAREVAGEPPLFYALQAIPYELGSGGSVLDRLALMRVLSALLAGVTVLFTYFFLRELLPASRSTWTVGALGIAFQPLFAFMSGGMNSDALLYAASAALFYLLARAFRRGLTQPLAVAIGAALAVALMTKFNGLGLLPGAAVALVVVAVLQERALSLRALRLPALALAVALAPTLLEMALNASVWNRAVVGATASNFNTAGTHPTLEGALNYVWQLFVVPLPGSKNLVGFDLPFRDNWINGLIGSYGWVDTEFRRWVYDIALIPLLAIAVLAGRTLVANRDVVRERRAELLSYVAIVLSVVAAVGLSSYGTYLRFNQSLAQTRYLFPLLPLYAALLALAARGAGRRWIPAAGTAIVMLAIAHNVFSQLLVIARYYA